MKKKIFLIWDLDGFIGAINSTSPYNYSPENHNLELKCVEQSLHLMRDYGVKCTFAITGYSAEDGAHPYTFRELIKIIYGYGHEIASHSWRHEWIPLFTKKQVNKSLARSKSVLEKAIDDNYSLSGFVPPHNKPATWLGRGAYSLEDRGLYPLFEMGDMKNLLKVLKENNYKWVRIAHNPFINRIKRKEFTRRQKVYNYKGTLILENHYTGFDLKIRDYIESKDQQYFTISAHPIMLAKKDDRPEAWENFKNFIEQFSNRKDFSFVCPKDELNNFNIH